MNRITFTTLTFTPPAFTGSQFLSTTQNTSFRIHIDQKESIEECIKRHLLTKVKKENSLNVAYYILELPQANVDPYVNPIQIGTYRVKGR